MHVTRVSATGGLTVYSIIPLRSYQRDRSQFVVKGADLCQYHLSQTNGRPKRVASSTAKTTLFGTSYEARSAKTDLLGRAGHISPCKLNSRAGR